MLLHGIGRKEGRMFYLATQSIHGIASADGAMGRRIDSSWWTN